MKNDELDEIVFHLLYDSYSEPMAGISVDHIVDVLYLGDIADFSCHDVALDQISGSLIRLSDKGWIVVTHSYDSVMGHRSYCRPKSILYLLAASGKD